MKTLIKKIFRFFSNKVLYFVLGFLISLSIVAVNIVWSASVAPNDPLTADLWNALENKVDSISSSWTLSGSDLSTDYSAGIKTADFINSSTLTLGAISPTNEGGEIAFRGAGANRYFYLDNFAGRLRYVSEDSTSESEKFTILNNGNVGIGGITAPSGKLHIVTEYGDLRLSNPSNSNPHYWDIRQTSPSTDTDQLDFERDDNVKMSITQDGNVVIAGKIQAGGDVCGAAGCLSGGGGSSLWETSGSNIYYNDGSVGIGTDDPKTKLDIRSSINRDTVVSIGGGLRWTEDFQSYLDNNARALIISGVPGEISYGVLGLSNNDTEGPNQRLGGIGFEQKVSGKSGTNPGGKASISGFSEGSGGSVGGYGGSLRFFTRPDNGGGDIEQYERMRIGSDTLTVKERVLRIEKESDGVNGGILEIGDVTSGDSWHIPIRTGNNRALEFHVWDNSVPDWRGPLLTIQKDGNIGIGTTPISSAKLHVYSTDKAEQHIQSGANRYTLLSGYNGTSNFYLGSNGTAAGAKIDITGISDNASYFGSRTSHPTQLISSNVVRMTIDNNGNVGIGTSGSDAKLHVKGGGTGGSSSGGLIVDEGGLVIKDRNSGEDLSEIRMITGNNYETHFYTYDNGRFGIHKYGTGAPSSPEVFSILNNGNVGIGILAPSEKLQIEDNRASGWAGVFRQLNTTGNGLFIHQQNSNGSQLAFRISNSTGVIFDILANGNVGIGTDDPGGDTLDVRGRAYASGGWQTTNADYAEWFEKEEGTTAGDLIGINLLTGKVRKYRTGDKFIGIHSQNAGVVGNRFMETDEEMSKTYTLVGLMGQLDFNESQTVMVGRIVKTIDGKEIGILLNNGKVLIGR